MQCLNANVWTSWLGCWIKKLWNENFQPKKEKKNLSIRLPLVVEQRALGIQSPWLQSRQPLTRKENILRCFIRFVMQNMHSNTAKTNLHTKHSVCSLWGALSFDFQRVYNPLVPLRSNAGHSENPSHNSSGLNEGDCFAHQHTYKHVHV